MWTKDFAVAVAFYLYNNVVSSVPIYSVRHAFLRYALKIHVGKWSAVHMGCFVTGRHIAVGEHSIVNRRCYLDGRVGLEIQNNVSIAPECALVSLDHDPRARDFATVPGPVRVCDYVWLGLRSIVLPGVTVGQGAVVGAGAVVARDVEPYSIVAGVPARKIGVRPRDLKYSLLYRPFFDTDVVPR